MSLLTIIQGAARRIAIPQPVAVIGETDPQVLALLGFAQDSGDEIARAHAWNVLTVRVTFTGVAANAQTGQPPAAFDRFTPLQRIWSNSLRTWLSGPITPDEWDGIVNSGLSTTPGYWTMYQGVINITPAPAVTDTFSYSYVSKNWIRPSGGASDGSSDISAWAADTNAALIPERLIILDLISKWKRSKGLDYSEAMEDFEREKEKAIARDRGARVIHMSRPLAVFPDNIWPETIG